MPREMNMSREALMRSAGALSALQEIPGYRQGRKFFQTCARNAYLWSQNDSFLAPLWRGFASFSRVSCVDRFRGKCVYFV